jgi:hypothetical protein
MGPLEEVTMEYLRGVSGGKLSWQQVMLGLLIFPLIGAVPLLFTQQRPSERMICVYVIAGTAATAALLIWSELHRRRKPDLQPDVLASVVPAGEIVETGDVHFALKARPYRSAIQLELLVQNLYDAPRTFDLKAEVVAPADAKTAGLVPIAVGVAGAGVSAARILIPLGPLRQRCDLAIAILADTRGGGGRKVRFRRRQLMWKPPAMWVKVATVGHGGAIGGIIQGLKGTPVYTAATTLTVTVGPIAGATAAAPDLQPQIDTHPLWATGDSADERTLQARVREFFHSTVPPARA